MSISCIQAFIRDKDAKAELRPLVSKVDLCVASLRINLILLKNTYDRIDHSAVVEQSVSLGDDAQGSPIVSTDHVIELILPLTDFEGDSPKAGR